MLENSFISPVSILVAYSVIAVLIIIAGYLVYRRQSRFRRGTRQLR